MNLIWYSYTLPGSVERVPAPEFDRLDCQPSVELGGTTQHVVKMSKIWLFISGYMSFVHCC